MLIDRFLYNSSDFHYEMLINRFIYYCSDSRNEMDGHRGRVFALQHHPVQPYSFVSGGWDDTVQVCIVFIEKCVTYLLFCLTYVVLFLIQVTLLQLFGFLFIYSILQNICQNIIINIWII